MYAFNWKPECFLLSIKMLEFMEPTPSLLKLGISSKVKKRS